MATATRCALLTIAARTGKSVSKWPNGGAITSINSARVPTSCRFLTTLPKSASTLRELRNIRSPLSEHHIQRYSWQLLRPPRRGNGPLADDQKRWLKKLVETTFGACGEQRIIMENRRRIRPVKKFGLADKVFKQVVTTTKISEAIRRRVMNAQHRVVAADLKKGSIRSLGDYLDYHNGIPDRQVALELGKLLSGSVHDTPYRLLIIEHPDLPKRVGGAPKKKSNKPTAKQLALARDFEESQRGPRPRVHSDLDVVAKRHGVSRSTVDRARKVVAAAELTEQIREAKERAEKQTRTGIAERHEDAINALRAENKKPTE